MRFNTGVITMTVVVVVVHGSSNHICRAPYSKLLSCQSFAHPLQLRPTCLHARVIAGDMTSLCHVTRSAGSIVIRRDGACSWEFERAACLSRYMDNEGSADRRRWLIWFGVKNPDSLQRMTIQTIRLNRLVSAEIIALFLEQLATFRQHFTQAYT